MPASPDRHPSRVVVIGGGSWGTAVARLLGHNFAEVGLWVYEPDLAERIASRRENDVYLPGVTLPDSLRPFSDPAGVLGADLVVWAVPSHVARATIQRFVPFLTGGELSVSLVKGIEERSLETMSQMLGELLPGGGTGRIVVLSGPSFAREVAADLPTAVVAAGKSPEDCRLVQECFSRPSFRIYVHGDPVGVEIGGALKNIMAIAVGISDGMQLGDNARAALITRGLAEIIRLGVALGSDARTFAGLAGIGDLVLTCTGGLSRNRSVGLKIGQGEPLSEILGGMRMVAEGVHTVKGAVELAARTGIDMSITGQVHRILYEGADPRRSVEDLIARPLTAEWR